MILAGLVVAWSFLLTFLALRAATFFGIFDLPSARSSHTVRTPRAGGISIVLSFYSGLWWLYMGGSIPDRLLVALLWALPVVGISLFDDIKSVRPRYRFLTQFLCAGVALYSLGGVSGIGGSAWYSSGWWANILVVLGIVWMTNLYNFLDGIDGYASSEAVFVGIAAYILYQNSVALLLAAACLGFLFWNWPRAKIFMGDVGSAFLGFTFGVLVAGSVGRLEVFVGWLVLLGLFWFDATITLVRRARHGEPVAEPHKKHAYQRLVQAGYSHGFTVVCAMAINVVAFVPLYLLGNSRWIGVYFLAYLLLLGILYRAVGRGKAFE